MIHLIAKPLKGKKAKLLDKIGQRLSEAGEEFRFHFTESKGDATKLARELTASPCLLIVVGGDGTLNDVLNGIEPENCTLGLIPAGTGNDFATAAKIPKGLPALELILNGAPLATDFLEFSDGRRSLNIAGLGIDVEILARCERMKHFHAKSKYFLSLLAALFHFRGTEMKIRAGGEEIEGNFLIAAACNGKEFGGGIPICPIADIQDGKLDLVYVDCPKRIKIPFALIKLMRGKVLELPIAHHIRCEEAELSIKAPFTAQYDGELYWAERFCVRVRSGLRMFRGEYESL